MELARLRAELDAAGALIEEADERAARAEELRRRAEQRRETAELEASTEKLVRESIQAQFDQKRVKAAEAALDPELREALRACVHAGRPPTPHQALQALQILYPERVAVLPEALHSAATEASRFRKPVEVLGLLVRLCTEYYEGMIGGGETAAKKAFTTTEFASRGSTTEENSEACVRERTRLYQGKAVVIWPHLRVGGHGAAEDCLRIHFAWSGEDRRIVIGHCGGHLRTA
ncbi:MAG: hypothetical protein ACHREM_06360 [Polyangiales bacterium]